MSKKQKKFRPWKKHEQTLVSLHCGVRTEVDANVAELIKLLNRHGIETRHSCEGSKGTKSGRYPRRGYVSMFAGREALELGRYLFENGDEVEIYIERDIHPHGYKNLTFRWPKKNQKKLEKLIRKYYS